MRGSRQPPPPLPLPLGACLVRFNVSILPLLEQVSIALLDNVVCTKDDGGGHASHPLRRASRDARKTLPVTPHINHLSGFNHEMSPGRWGMPPSPTQPSSSQARKWLPSTDTMVPLRTNLSAYLILTFLCLTVVQFTVSILLLPYWVTHHNVFLLAKRMMISRACHTRRNKKNKSKWPPCRTGRMGTRRRTARTGMFWTGRTSELLKLESM